MGKLEFGTTGFHSAFEGADSARLSEAMGFDIQSFGENHARAADCFGEMRDAARATSRIKLTCGPVNFVTRNAGVIASSILPIHLLSGGRAICGVASGDSAVAAADLKPQRLADMERNIRQLRAYLKGDEVPLGTRTSRIEWAQGLARPPLPIEAACSGPKSIAMAARTADRIYLGIGTNLERVKWALDIIEAELAAQGRSRGDVRIGLFAPLAVTDDRPSGRRALRTRVAAWAHMQSGKGTDLSQQPAILRKVTTVLRDSYDYSFHRADAPAENPNTAICDEEFGEWMGIGGPATYIVDRLGELAELGVDHIMTALPPDERERFASGVMPKLR
jgi:alkanesulfonate monooxygenase SsuD/methylene tetrahydromethanopterin reductase-like flavin-dependent oxidoreductase (luciferase family)